MLETEINFYEQHQVEWTSRYPGKFALVKEATLIGTFDTFEEALIEGARQFKLQSFLVRPIGKLQRQISIPALTLDLLHASPSYPIQR